MDGLRGARGGDIGCERQPVAEFFPAPARAMSGQFPFNRRTIRSSSSHSNISITGVAPAGTVLSVADASKWDSLESLLASKRYGITRIAHNRLVDTEIPANGTGLFFATAVIGTEQMTSSGKAYNSYDSVRDSLPPPRGIAPAIAGRVDRCVERRTRFINAAVPVRYVSQQTPFGMTNSRASCTARWRGAPGCWAGAGNMPATRWAGMTARRRISPASPNNRTPVPSPRPSTSAGRRTVQPGAQRSGDSFQRRHVEKPLRRGRWRWTLFPATSFGPVIQTTHTKCGRCIERHLGWERRMFRREFGPG